MAPKRKMNQKSKPSSSEESKLQRLEESLEPAKEVVQLPEELWREIIAHCKREDNCLINLSQTCKLFNEICKSRFSLKLSFDRILAEKSYPVIKRSYEKIQFTGKEISSDDEKIHRMLETSQTSAVLLDIKGNSVRYDGGPNNPNMNSRMFSVTFWRTIGFLPNLQELTISNLNLLKSDRKFDNIGEETNLDVSSLKKLTLESVDEKVLFAIVSKTKKLEELVIVELDTNKPSYRNASALYNESFKGLDQLKIFRDDSDAIFPLKMGFPKLETLRSVSKGCWSHGVHKNLIALSPNLKHWTIRERASTSTNGVNDLLSYASASVLTVEIKYEIIRYCPTPWVISFDDILKNFPSLIELKSKRLPWKKET